MQLKMNILVASTICATLFCGDIFAAKLGINTSFDISAVLQGAITVTKIRDLSFPQQTTGTAGAHTVAPTDTTSAVFSATGTPNSVANLTFGAATVTLSCTAGGGGTCVPGTDTLDITAFKCDSTTCSYTFNTSGDITSMSFGATENVLVTSKSGTYTGTQNITLIYA